MKKRLCAALALAVVLVIGVSSFASAGTWMESGSGWWYQNDNGSFPTSTWQQIDGSWYHFNGAGYLDTGWFHDNGTWYYFYPNGTMATGWVELDGFWYYFLPDGSMAKGWHQIDGTWYFMRPDGVAFSSVNYGDHGNAVWYMQEQLVRLGYLYASAADGLYGDATYAAVCAFKAANGDSTPNGAVDGSVLEMMCNSYTYFSPVGEYSSYSEIYAVQNALVNYGLLNAADGWYGSGTRDAVMQIQSDYGLSQTGVCDMATLKVIFNLGYLGYPGSDVQYYDSYTNWLIYVNTTTNMLYVYWGGYGNWQLQYSWRVSTGAWETPTVLGQYTVQSKGYSFGEGYTCYYWTGFYYDYLFHSTLYWEDTFIPMDPALGQNISHGCVRMAIENAKWIYDNIPYGTKVVIVR